MAFGDPANGGADHGSRDAGTVGVTTDTSTPAFATIAGNTLIIGVRGGAASGVISVNVSENSGTSYSAATLADVQKTVTSVGQMAVFYFPNLAGAVSGNVRIQVNFATAATMRYNWAHYTGAFTFGTAAEAESGAGQSNAYDSGALTTSVISTLIGFATTGRNTVGTDPPVPGTTNGLTWTTRDHLTDGNSHFTSGLFDFNAGGQAAGTYHCLGTLAGATTDNWGAEIYSFTQAGGASAAHSTPPVIAPSRAATQSASW